MTRSPHGLELYFPPLRHVGTALALAVFGAIAAVFGTVGSFALLPGAVAHTAGLMTAVLVATFAVPFAIFGVAFVALALYMALNALTVQVGAEAIAIQRTLLGMRLRREVLLIREMRTIEPQIATRDQSPFAAEPVYRLYAVSNDRSRRLVVAESLTGEALMQKVKEILERAIHGTE